MANILSGFFDNLLSGALNPKGNLGDSKTSSYLYSSNSFRLAPKHKFLYHVAFEMSPEAIRFMPDFLTQRHRTELNMLVKQAQMPKYQAQVETRNQYNRKKNFQTAVEYQPVELVLHDDNRGVTAALMEAYYRYYFRDGNNFSSAGSITGAFNPRGSYKGAALNKSRYGLDNGSINPFFTKITVYQLARKEYQAYELINPLITKWGHDDLDNSDNAGITANSMEFVYEAVRYYRGQIGEDNPTGFATQHYDVTPSPLKIEGGGTVSVFGDGGFADGVGSVLGDIVSGDVNLETIIQGGNTLLNSRKLSSEGLREEGFSLAGSILGKVASSAAGGLANIAIPKSNGNGGDEQTTPATGGKADRNAPNYLGRVNGAT